MQITEKEYYNIEDLLQIMKQLRGENGCPWDREQTHQSIRKNMIEEAYEVCEAIDKQDAALLQEELGDVLMQVVFHSLMEEEISSFTFEDVVNGVCQKLILRHPHVFGEVKLDTADQVLDRWDAIKRKSKGQKTITESLRAVPSVLPALMRAQKILGRASKAKKDCEDASSALRKCQECLQHFPPKVSDIKKEEIGKLLFQVTELARQCGIDSEEALMHVSDSYIAAFEREEIKEPGG